MKGKLLILEDEKALGETLCDFLHAKNYHCQLVTTLKSATAALDQGQFDVAIFDINLPDGTSFELVKKMREKNKKLVFIFLSAMSDPDMRLEGLELGAEDYITKPFELRELLLRLERILKRQESMLKTPESVRLGKLRIWFKKYEVQNAQGKIISLSQKECAMLQLLYDRQGQAVSRDDMIDLIWGQDSFPSHRTIDNYIVALRKWAETDLESVRISSIRSIGYKLEILTEVVYE